MSPPAMQIIVPQQRKRSDQIYKIHKGMVGMQLLCDATKPEAGKDSNHRPKLLLHWKENLEFLQIDFLITNFYNVVIARALEWFQRPLLFFHSVKQQCGTGLRRNC